MNNKKRSLIILNSRTVFPFERNELILGREFSINAAKNAIESDEKEVIVCAQEKEGIDPTPEQILPFGIIAKIDLSKVEQFGDSMKVVLVCSDRVLLKSISFQDNCFFGEFDFEQEIEPAKYEAWKKIVIEKISHMRVYFEEQSISIGSILAKDLPPKETVFQILSALFPIEEAKVLINTCTIHKILSGILEDISEKEHASMFKTEILKKTQERMRKEQEKLWLQEQIKTMKSKLNDGDESEDLLLKSIKAAKLPKEVEQVALAEHKKLSSIPFVSSEGASIRNYIKWILDIPWNKEKELNYDIDFAKKVLEESHFGMEQVKEEILEYIAAQSRSSKLPAILLVGPPGVGKSTICAAVAKATGRAFESVSMAGAVDAAKFIGHSRTYVGAIPGVFMQKLKLMKYKNGLIQIDEVDKRSDQYRFPETVLLSLLDPKMNIKFEDAYMDIPFDFSKTLFILTANYIDNISPEILNRVHVIQVPGYTDKEKLEITQRIFNKTKEEMKITENISITTNAITKIIMNYTKENGVRQLSRMIEKCLRKILLLIEEKKINKKKKLVVTQRNVEQFLGPITYPEREPQNSQVGVCTGMAYTQSGGDILRVMAVNYPGKGDVLATGNLGKVIEESTKIAISCLKSKYKELGIDPSFFKENDFHISFESGAVSKDGPSAGITIFSALLSLVKQKPIRADIAMTGEISLNGDISVIGGLKEKFSGAVRNGIKEVLIPYQNRTHIEKLPKELIDSLKITFVKNVSEIVDKIFSI